MDIRSLIEEFFLSFFMIGFGIGVLLYAISLIFPAVAFSWTGVVIVSVALAIIFCYHAHK